MSIKARLLRSLNEHAHTYRTCSDEDGSISIKDAELIALIGTEVDDGYLVLNKDYLEIERQVKVFLDRCRRMVGKRLVVANGQIVTAYHSSKRYQRRLLRNVQESEFNRECLQYDDT